MLLEIPKDAGPKSDLAFTSVKMRIFEWRYVHQYKYKTDHYLARPSIMLTYSFLLICKKTRLKITNKEKYCLVPGSFITPKTCQTLHNSFEGLLCC